MRRQLQPSTGARRQLELRALAARALGSRPGALVACGEVTRDDVNRLSNLAQAGAVTAAFTASGGRFEDPVRRLVIEHQRRGYWCEAHDLETIAEVLPAEPYPTAIAFLHLKGGDARELTDGFERLEPLVHVGGTVVLEDGGGARGAIARLAEARGLVSAPVEDDALSRWLRPSRAPKNDETARQDETPVDPRPVSGSEELTILAYPQSPGGKFALLCEKGGFRITRDVTRPFDLAIKWHPETYTPNDRVLDELARITPVVNLGCDDISKRRVEDAHREVFGYGLLVDPHTYRGTCVKKTNLNAQNRESLVECPIAPGDGDAGIGHGFIYQRLVVTPREPQEYEEYRVPITGREIPCVVIKRRPLSVRFDRCAGYAALAEVDEVFSADERAKILELCRVFGLDFGDLDILRERDGGRLHVIDVNPTPGGPGAAGYGYTEEQRQELLSRQLAAFRRVFVDRLGDARGGQS
ncbi:MAG: hypothetical protein AAGF23_01100 [Acidobacteriota bacterium]